MQLKVRCFVAAIFSLALSSCGSGSNSGAPDNTAVDASAIGSVSVSPVNVVSEYVQRLSPPVLEPVGVDYLSNGDFENGTADWTGCGAGTISEFTAAYDGEKALRVSGGNCFYQVVPATPDEDLVLSCYARVLSNIIWTGMGLSFSDSNWDVISETPATVVTGYGFERYDVRATVPASSEYVTMWFYTESDAIVDNCSLLPADIAPPPPINNAVNLLENAEFDTTNNGLPEQWLKFCGGSLAANREIDDVYVMISDGACISQSLSASDIASMQGKAYEYSCDIDLYTDNYVSIVLNLDGEDYTAVVPPGHSDKISVVVDAPASITSGYVGIYSEASERGMRVYNCALSPVEEIEPPVTADDNLLFNASFDERDAANKPQGWSLGCNGTWESIDSPLSEAALEISASTGFACVEQELGPEQVAALSENTYTISCDAWNYEQGWGLLQIKSGGVEKRHYINNTADYEPVVFTGELSYLTEATFGVYASRGMRVDNCSLVADPLASGGNIASIDIRANVEGPEFYAIDGSLDYEVVVTNNGTLTLDGISFRDPVDSCTGSVASLQPGESYTQSCLGVRKTDQTESIEITATASVSDGSEVSDTDAIGFRTSLRPDPSVILSIRSNQRTIASGDDAVFTVSVAVTGNVAAVGNVSTFQIAPLDGYQDVCDKTYSTPLLTGQYDVYECTLTNVTESQVINAEVVSGNPPYRAILRDSASVTVE